MSRNAMDRCIEEVNESEDQREIAREERQRLAMPTHKCPKCGARYFAAGVCNWHDVDQELVPVGKGGAA